MKFIEQLEGKVVMALRRNQITETSTISIRDWRPAIVKEVRVGDVKHIRVSYCEDKQEEVLPTTDVMMTIADYREHFPNND